MNKRCPLVVLIFIIPFFLFAQTRQIKGTVTDEKGSPLASVSVVVKNSKNGTQTDALGNFTLSVAGSGKVTLIVSFLGYKIREITADPNTPVSVTLEQAPSNLDDVVVVGYQTVKRRDLTSSVSSVGSRDLRDVPINSAA